MKMLMGIHDGNKVPYPLGHFFFAINISNFTEPEAFKKTAGNILREIRASRKMPGCERIYTAGEKEHLTWLERKKTGVPVNEALQQEIRQVLDAFGMENPGFPF
jgi:LDH2 family malate/lactate/ureidoglycolate dehydrogenase